MEIIVTVAGNRHIRAVIITAGDILIAAPLASVIFSVNYLNIRG